MLTIVIFDDEQYSIKELRGLLPSTMPAGVPYTVFEARTLRELRDILATDTQVDILSKSHRDLLRRLWEGIRQRRGLPGTEAADAGAYKDMSKPMVIEPSLMFK